MSETAHITPHRSSVTTADRMRITGTRPAVYWMTGLSGSGKSTVAARAEQMLIEAGFAALMIDGDTVRTGLCRGLGFSPDDRHENLRRIAELSKIAALSGQIVVVCTISPDEESRRTARSIIERDADFRLVYVKASVEECARRDPKGLYKKAYAGEIPDFTGVSAPFDEPDADLVLATAEESVEESAARLVSDAIARQFDRDTLIGGMIEAGLAASRRIMEIYERDYAVSFKEDSSPLTEADVASNETLVSYFRTHFPAYSILSEEEADSDERLTNQAGVFIIDPLDGTKEFIHKNGEFCISLGFARRHRVIAGVILVPAQRLIYYAVAGYGSYKISYEAAESQPFTVGMGERLHVSDRSDRVIVAASRSHRDAETEALLTKNEARVIDVVTAGSCLKGCLIAEGKIDVHVRFGAFMKEWDTAAMQIIVEEAGGVFCGLDGRPIPANRADPVHRGGFMMLNHPASALSL